MNLMTEGSVPFSVNADAIAARIDDAATAVDAAVQQLAAEAALKLSAEAIVVRHPSASLHDDVVSAIIPAIEVFAAHKNVALANHEYESLAKHALEHVSRKSMRGILAGNVEAIAKIQLAINHTLDVLGATRLLAALIAIEGRAVPDAATLVRMGEASMKSQFANDKAPSIRIWPDVAAIASEHRMRISQAVKQPQMLTMPNGASINCAVRQPSDRWAAIIRAATPGWEGLIHE